MVAEDNINTIVYQLQPEIDAQSVFVISNSYSVDQSGSIIRFVPVGTSVPALLNNLIPSPGASIKVVDKLYNLRTTGNVARDDKLIVTSQSGLITKEYTLFLVDEDDILKNIKVNDFTLLTAPNISGTFCGLTSNELITIEIVNNGIVPISNFNIGYSVDQNFVTEETYNGTLDSGETLQYSFTARANLATTEYFKSFQLDFYINYNDNISEDNELRKFIRVFGDYIDASDWTTFNLCDGVNSNISFALAEDKNGDVWSTDFYGASKFDGENWTVFTSENGLGDDYSWAIMDDSEGNIWFPGTSNLVITKYDGNGFTQYPQPANYEECIYEDTNGNIWFGAWKGAGVAKFDGNTWTYYDAETHNLGNFVSSIGEDSNGVLYFANSNGITVFDGNNWDILDYPGGNTFISEIFFDSNENTWFTAGGVIYYYDGENWSEFPENETGLQNCEDISEDISGNIWFGGDVKS